MTAEEFVQKTLDERHRVLEEVHNFFGHLLTDRCYILLSVTLRNVAEGLARDVEAVLYPEVPTQSFTTEDRNERPSSEGN